MGYLLRAPADCDDHPFLVIYVHSAPQHRGRRRIVRSTWGNVTRWTSATAGVKLRFIMGRSGNSSYDVQRRALAVEQAEFGDLVQLDFVDSYRNMTLKAVGALQWLNEYCRDARLEPVVLTET